MKKQFIAKLLVLVMVLAMIPAAMLTANAAGGNNSYYNKKGPADTAPIAATGNSYSSTGSTAAASSSSAAAVKADAVTIEDGTAAIKATVTNGVANVSLSDAAVEKLEDAVEDDVITLEIADEGATRLNVDFKAKTMADVAKDTGADLVIKSTVATITIPNDILQSDALKTGTVKVSAHTGVSVGFTIRVSGKTMKDITGISITF